jgi:chromosome partitioning protein
LTPLEKPVRKLLVASQKSGVGKTTTSINLAAAAALGGTRVLLLDADPLSCVANTLRLAAHPGRSTLRQIGLDLPGALVCDVAPGLDVLSPYDAGPCSDADLDDLLRLTDAPPFRDSYGCLVVDSPPFLGANPVQLVGACDGLVIVAQAEPLAHRTLPAFLELVQRSRGERPIQTHGVLVTLPEGEEPGDRCERELRGRLGSKALPLSIPFDEEVRRAAVQGRVVAHTRPDSPAAVQYHRLAETLKLAEDPLPLKKAPGPAPLLAAAAALLAPVGAAGRGDVFSAPPVSEAPEADAPEDTVHDKPAPDLPPPSMPELPTFSGLAKVSPPSLTLPAFRPPPAAIGRLETKPTGPEEEPRPASPRRSSDSGSPVPWVIGVGLAVVLGVGLRFVQLPDYMLPLAVGFAVAAAVVLVLRLLLTAPEAPRPEQTLTAALPRPAAKRPPADGRNDAPTRLSALARSSASGPYRRPRRS